MVSGTDPIGRPYPVANVHQSPVSHHSAGDGQDPQRGIEDPVTISTVSKAQARQSSNPVPSSVKESNQGLTPEDQRRVDQLKQRDQEVKAHERAHMTAGSGVVQGGATYTFEKGTGWSDVCCGGRS